MSNIPQQIGNYVLEREIGRGATSEVWLGRHTELEDRKVAIKVLMAYDRETIRRFRREASLTSRLNHPNIVQVYDHGQSTPVYYTVMEYVHGGSLRQMIEKQQRLQVAEAFSIFKQVAAALDYAHGKGIIHRDVSPGNVLIEQATGRTLLTDFGIAREPDQSITVTNSIMGTPGYLSPEHATSAKAVTHLSDIFGLGVIFYVMLSGELPWEEPPGPLERVFPAPVSLRQRGVTNLPSDIDRVIQTLLANDPAKRFPSAGAAMAELERIFVRHEVITQVTTPVAHAPSPGGQFAVLVSGVEQNPVETVLGPDLVRAPIAKAHQRAEDLRRPDVIADLLNTWSAQDRLRLRRELLGRLARLHKVSSRNVYYYRLRVLYERREKPRTIEEPDYNAQVFPLEPELDRWQVQLPPVQDFADDEGAQLVLPGSTRIANCAACSGKGVITCKRCNGKQRIYEEREVLPPAVDLLSANPPGTPAPGAKTPVKGQTTTIRQTPPGGVPSGAGTPAAGAVASAPPAAPRIERVLVPCPDCSGRGGLTCERCDGVGRLIERQAFRWKRVEDTLTAQDDLSNLDEDWLKQNFASNEIYRERASNGFRSEWGNIPLLKDLIDSVQVEVDDQTRIVLSEVTISFIPVSDIVFDLGKYNDGDPDDKGLYRMAIYGFENYIPQDWRFLNWERVLSAAAVLFLLILTIVLGYFAFV